MEQKSSLIQSFSQTLFPCFKSYKTIHIPQKPFGKNLSKNNLNEFTIIEKFSIPIICTVVHKTNKQARQNKRICMICLYRIFYFKKTEDDNIHEHKKLIITENPKSNSLYSFLWQFYQFFIYPHLLPGR